MTYVVARVTVDEIVAGLITYGLATTDTADYTGQLLWATNEDAVRYHGLTWSDLSADYHYKPVGITRGQLARSIVAYAHNSSGLPSWSDSEARELVLTLAFAMLPDVPGYEGSEAR